jgi:hypothetical protein
MVTYETMYPTISPIEDKMKLLLVMRGYDRNKISFRNNIYNREMRYGYWESVKTKDIEYIETFSGVKFKPFFSTEDDDCGPLISYPFKETKNARSRHSAD